MQVFIYSNEKDVARNFDSVSLSSVIAEKNLYLNLSVTN